MTATTFWSADGRPMFAAQFLEFLFGALPEFFRNEDELRGLWSDPDTRMKLLAALADRGFGKEPLAEMQKIIEAEKSDLFDVLAYVAFAAAPRSRQQRAEHARQKAAGEFTDKQPAFIDFVLSHYVRQGVDELDQEKLSPLLRLKYRALPDALPSSASPIRCARCSWGFSAICMRTDMARQPDRSNDQAVRFAYASPSFSPADRGGKTPPTHTTPRSPLRTSPRCSCAAPSSLP